VQQQPKVTQLAIDASDRLTADNQPMALEGLRMYLRKHALEHPDGVVISTHPNASHNVLTQAMDAAQAAGIQKLAVTRQE
jgi:biopolymer transport protein ExbD